MNKLDGKITSIKSDDHMSIVEMDVSGNHFKTIIIETPGTAGFLYEGSPVKIMFKETEVSIAKNFSGLISLQNKLNGNIKEIETGKLLSKITLDCKGDQIISVITAAAAGQMELRKGDSVLALVKTNEIIIAPL